MQIMMQRTDEIYKDDALSEDALGMYQVGYQSITFDYELPMDLAQVLNDQINEQPANTGSRKVRLGIWYPTIADENTTFARYPFLANRHVAYDRSPMIESDHKFPLYLYSHGAKVWPELGAFEMEYLASHGWIAIGIEHDHDQIQTAALPRPDAMYILRPMDVQQVLNYLYSDQADPSIKERISEKFVMAGGHSYGGYTTLALSGAQYRVEEIEADCGRFSDQFCQYWPTLKPYFQQGMKEDRIKFSVPQSAGDYRLLAEGVKEIAIPTLLVTAKRDQNCTEEGSNLPYWQMLSSSITPENKHHLSFAQAGHASLTLTCEHLPGIELDNGCGMDFTPAVQVQHISNRYALIFARAYLAQQSQALDLLNMSHQNEIYTLENTR